MKNYIKMILYNKIKFIKQLLLLFYYYRSSIILANWPFECCNNELRIIEEMMDNEASSFGIPFLIDDPATLAME